MPRFFLGLDPGFANIGYCVVYVEDATLQFKPMAMGVIRTSDKNLTGSVSEKNMIRVNEITKTLNNLITTWQPISIVCEAMSYPRNASTAGKMSLCWGAIGALSTIHNIDLVQVSPQNIKKCVAGIKTASKDDIINSINKIMDQSEIEALLKKTNVPSSLREHAYDAFGAVYSMVTKK